MRVSKFSIMKRVALAVALASALGFLPAHAGGGTYGFGTVPYSPCKGGELTILGVNSSGPNWIFDVSLVCTTEAPQHVTIAGNWNAEAGGPVLGFGDGSLMIGPVSCGSNGNVTVQVQMLASALVTAKTSFSRYCD
ncbi:MAG: hypothetical protein ACYDCC_06995 [Actinomycetota bacterium]